MKDNSFKKKRNLPSIYVLIKSRTKGHVMILVSESNYVINHLIFVGNRAYSDSEWFFVFEGWFRIPIGKESVEFTVSFHNFKAKPHSKVLRCP